MEQTLSTSLQADTNAALALIKSGISDHLSSLMEQDKRLAPLQTNIRELSTLLVKQQLFKKEGTEWKFSPDRISSVSEADLTKIQESLYKTFLTSIEDSTVLALDEGGKKRYIETLQEVKNSLEKSGHDIPPSKLFEDVAVLNETVIVTEITNESLHRSAIESLGFLENLHTSALKMEDSPVKKEYADLVKALKAAYFVTPEENPNRSISFRHQTPRGSRSQNEDILKASQNFVEAFDTPETKKFIEENSANSMIDQLLAVSFEDYKKEISNIKEESVEKDVQKPLSETFIPGSPIDLESARALYSFLEITEILSHECQWDTKDDNYVLVPYTSVLALWEASSRLSKTDAVGFYKEAEEGLTNLPGISTETAKDVLEAIKYAQNLLDEGIQTRMEKGQREDPGAQVALSKDAMDGYIQYSNILRDTGAFLSIGAHADIGDVKLSSLFMGRDAVASPSAAEAMRTSRPATQDGAVFGYGQILPEMSVPAFTNLSKKVKAEALNSQRLVHLVPGEGHFSGYSATPVNYGNAQEWHNARLRNYIQKKLRDDKDGSFKQYLRQLSGKTIVAPTLQEAKILREEANKLRTRFTEDMKKKTTAYLDNAEIKHANFKTSDVIRFIEVYNASGDNKLPTLTLRGQNLTIEHDGAPILEGKLDKVGILASQNDGYKLAKVNMDALVQACESGLPHIVITIADDRPIAYKGEKAVQQKTKNHER